MKDIALIQCTNKPLPFDDSSIPIQLLSVAGTLQEKGFKPKIFDIRKEPVNKLGGCDMVVANITTGQSIKEGLEMAQLANYLEVPMVWMGTHPSVSPELFARPNKNEYVISGDADLALPELVMRLEAGQNGLPKIWIKKCENLDSLPFVPFDLIDLKQYGGGAGLPILTSRGCPHACTFCLDRALNRGHWRSMSPPRIIEHVQHYKDSFGIRDFKFFDDNFCADLNRVEKVSESLIKEKSDIEWSTSCRVDYVKDMKPELFKLMKDSGCWNLAFGFESGSQRMLDLCNKHVKVEEIKVACKKLSENNMDFGGTFQVGFPTETREDIFDTLDLMTFLVKNAPNATFETYDYIPHVGTTLFDKAMKFGFPISETLEGWTYVDFVNKPWITKEHRKLIDRVKLLSNLIGRPVGKNFSVFQRLARQNINNIKRLVL